MSANPLQTAAEFVQQLADDLNKGDLELPLFPDTVVRIQRAFRAEQVDLDEIIRIITSDPALAASVLRLSNSVAFRSVAEIADVRQAVIRMGHKMVQSSTVAFAMRQVESSKDLSNESRMALKAIWTESIELAALCHVLTRKFTKLSADEALLMGLLSVLGRLYIFMKSQNFGSIANAELETILFDWHPAICKSIAESWGMTGELLVALETQLDTDPPVQESATLAEVLAAAKIILDHHHSDSVLNAGEYPLLQRLGIAGHSDTAFTLDDYAEEIDAIRMGLSG